jgi:hypothetical protein
LIHTLGRTKSGPGTRAGGNRAGAEEAKRNAKQFVARERDFQHVFTLDVDIAIVYVVLGNLDRRFLADGDATPLCRFTEIHDCFCNASAWRMNFII